MSPEHANNAVSAKRRTMNGSLLWFDRDKDVGIIVGEDGERFDVQGEGFVPGSRPTGRCKGTEVTFDLAEEAGGVSVAVSVAIVPESAQRRARPRRRLF
jgi:hypothetical protein